MTTCRASDASIMTRWPERDPGEPVVVEFDFTRLGDNLSDVSVTVDAYSRFGVYDPAPAAVLTGPATPEGGIVRQLITGGVDLVDYILRCQATPTGYGYPAVITAALPTRAR